MRYIQKNEPQWYLEWKSSAWVKDNYAYQILKNPEKQNLHQALLEDQGYICCYCGERVAHQTFNNVKTRPGDSHIEHLKPQKHFKNLVLEYENLLISCQGQLTDNGNPKEPVHCGPAKKDWPDPSQENDMVAPTDPNCAEYFTFTAAGEILPTKDPIKHKAASATIQKLGLGIDKLIDKRKKALEAFLLEEDLTVEGRDKLIQRFNNLNISGQYEPFCAAILHILRNDY